VVGSCEHGNEPSVSVNSGEFLNQLRVVSASLEGLLYFIALCWCMFQLWPQNHTVTQFKSDHED
jgi:hypothetical protein